MYDLGTGELDTAWFSHHAGHAAGLHLCVAELLRLFAPTSPALPQCGNGVPLCMYTFQLWNDGAPLAMRSIRPAGMFLCLSAGACKMCR